MVVLTISADGLRLITVCNTIENEIYSSFPKIREHVPEIKKETIQEIITPYPTLCLLVGV